MPIQPLIDELTNDPEGKGYAGMNDAQAAQALNERNIRVDQRRFFRGGEIKAAVAAADWGRLTDLKKQQFLALVQRDDIDLFGNDAAILEDIFVAGVADNTRTAIRALRKANITRAEQAGDIKTPVRPAHVKAARLEAQRRADPAAYVQAKRDARDARRAAAQALIDAGQNLPGHHSPPRPANRQPGA